MKRVLVFLILISLLIVTSSSAFAEGLPAKHGVDGRTFGGLVSEADPGWLVEHIRGATPSPSVAGGLPAKHGVDGRTFGGLVSEADPGWLVEHIRGAK